MLSVALRVPGTPGRRGDEGDVGKRADTFTRVTYLVHLLWMTSHSWMPAGGEALPLITGTQTLETCERFSTSSPFPRGGTLGGGGFPEHIIRQVGMVICDTLT